jgi:hypothetical protein
MEQVDSHIDFEDVLLETIRPSWLGLWGGRCHIFLRPRRGRIWCGHFSLPKDLLYKDIPLILYVNTENVMDWEHAFIAWVHNGMNIAYVNILSILI